MKKLLNSIYIISADNYLSLDGENVVVKKEGQSIGRFPLHNIENIITFGYNGASPAIMGECAKRNISLCFMGENGRFKARVVGKSYCNVLLRKKQYRVSDDENESFSIAKNFVVGKIYNEISVVNRTIRDHSMRIDTQTVNHSKNMLLTIIENVINSTNVTQLRGYEGKAAEAYFGIFDHLIINQKDDFIFSSRSRRPPLDNVNCLLSFLYTVLSNDCASALEGVGLDPYVGFMHTDRPGRISLALDLMEEFRSIVVDRLVLTLINRKQITNDNFIIKDNGAVLLTDSAKKIVLNAWQEKKKTTITHPYLKEKMQWGLIPHVQAMLLARYLRGDIEEYPPFLLK